MLEFLKRISEKNALQMNLCKQPPETTSTSFFMQRREPDQRTNSKCARGLQPRRASFRPPVIRSCGRVLAC